MFAVLAQIMSIAVRTPWSTSTPWRFTYQVPGTFQRDISSLKIFTRACLDGVERAASQQHMCHGNAIKEARYDKDDVIFIFLLFLLHTAKNKIYAFPVFCLENFDTVFDRGVSTREQACRRLRSVLLSHPPVLPLR